MNSAESRSITVKAYAKLNLWLDITGRRADAYHLLNTVMTAVDLADEVTVALNGSGGIAVSCDEPAVPADERNIAYRAAKLFAGLHDPALGADIVIKKHIPTEAGLGGSSTDGAAVLLAMNELCGKPFSADTLAAAGVRLGADVPFCVYGGTAVCRGIGEQIKPVSCPDFAALIVKPDFSCSTAAAYRAYDEAPRPEKPGFAEFCGALISGNFPADSLYNVFEELYADPRIADIRRSLLDAGALGACLTGSGSAVFGVFGTLSEARKAAEKLGISSEFAVKNISADR